MVCFDDVHPTREIEALGEAPCEPGRHVLHDQQGHLARGWQQGYHFGQRARSPGARCHRDCPHCPTGNNCRIGRRLFLPGHTGEHRHSRAIRHRRRIQGRKQGRADACQIFARRPCTRLGHDLDRTQLEGSNGGARSRPGVRADYDNGPRRFTHDVADGAQPVELRHLYIHRDEVGTQAVYFLESVHTVPGLPDHPVATRRLDYIRQHTPQQCTVVHDQH